MNKHLSGENPMHTELMPGIKNGKSFTTMEFTLIELLVVISIIMILASLLLPLLSRVKATGNTISCVANQKTLILGYLNYTDIYNGWLLPSNVADDAFGGSDSSVSWLPNLSVMIYDSVASPQPRTKAGTEKQEYASFRCPSEKLGFGNYLDGLFYYYSHYTINPTAAGTSFKSTATYPARKLINVKSPSLAPIFADNPNRAGYIFTGVTNNDIAYRHGGSTNSAVSGYKIIYFGTGFNAAFLDGHAQTVMKNNVTSAWITAGMY